MKIFGPTQARKAVAYAAAGNVAVHLHYPRGKNMPACFRRELDAGRPVAHVFAADAAELRRIGNHVGARKADIERPGTPLQHIDLCGAPLRRLMSMISEGRE